MLYLYYYSSREINYELIEVIYMQMHLQHPLYMLHKLVHFPKKLNLTEKNVELLELMIF